MKTKNVKSKMKIKYPERVSEVPVTQAMLYGVRDELTALVKSQFHGLKSEIDGSKSEIDGLKSEIHGLKSEIHGAKSEVNGLASEVHRLAVLIEEQNARNIIVMDGLTSLFTRQDRIENQVSELRQAK